MADQRDRSYANGLQHLKRLFAGLIEHTSYPALEVIVLDNASSDGTLDYLESLEAPFPVTVLASEDNLSFSEANARGARGAQGELLLFLNNDIEPFESAWLKELVCALDSDGVRQPVPRCCIPRTSAPRCTASDPPWRAAPQSRSRRSRRLCSTAPSAFAGKTR